MKRTGVDPRFLFVKWGCVTGITVCPLARIVPTPPNRLAKVGILFAGVPDRGIL
jgi:hypothetical protein